MFSKRMLLTLAVIGGMCILSVESSGDHRSPLDKCLTVEKKLGVFHLDGNRRRIKSKTREGGCYTMAVMCSTPGLFNTKGEWAHMKHARKAMILVDGAKKPGRYSGC